MTLDELQDWIADMQMNHPGDSTIHIIMYRRDTDEVFLPGQPISSIEEISPGLGLHDPREPDVLYE